MISEIPHTPKQIVAIEGLDLAYEADKAYNEDDTERFKALAKAAETKIGFNQPGASELKPVSKTIERLKRKTDQICEAMCEKYKEYGVRLHEFKAIQFDNKLVVAYVGNDGIDLGTTKKNEVLGPYDRKLSQRGWDSIQAKRLESRFMVKAGEKEYDTRKGMTVELQKELIDQGYITLNDYGNPRTSTWITSKDPIDDKHAPITGEYIEGKVITRSGYRQNTSKKINFRPVFVVTDNLTQYLADNFSE